MQIHLDPLGGWSGDMFVAALLDAFPDFWTDVQKGIAALDLGATAGCRLIAHRDAVLVGRRFLVDAEEGAGAAHGHRHDHHHAGDDHHHHADDAHDHHSAHRPWSAICDHLARSSLPAAARRHAIGIFGLLAEAEAAVHGIPVDEVAFHEVGAVDSIVDIAAAAQLIALIGATRWTASPLPLGSGRIRTAHGLLPVPAPATALLLRGLPTLDDGIPGERVTPTGAAVARYLLSGADPSARQPRRLVATGTGFGARTMPGISNCLRVLAFEEEAFSASPVPQGAFTHRELGVITFEVDDQSAEDLAHGLDHIRAMPGIHDVIQSVAYGKKGRMATQVQVLVAPAELDAAIAACFEETTTIGLRYHTVRGAALGRSVDRVEIGAHPLRVKMVRRPGGGMTGKTEAADVAALPGHAARVALRRTGEAVALDRATAAGDDGSKRGDDT